MCVCPPPSSSPQSRRSITCCERPQDLPEVGRVCASKGHWRGMPWRKLFGPQHGTTGSWAGGSPYPNHWSSATHPRVIMTRHVTTRARRHSGAHRDAGGCHTRQRRATSVASPRASRDRQRSVDGRDEMRLFNSRGSREQPPSHRASGRAKQTREPTGSASQESDERMSGIVRGTRSR
jgi:hypothetical protein